MFSSPKIENYPIVSQETRQSNVDYVEVVSYILLNSSDRNTTSYPSVNSYRINPEETFRNIHSIELIAASLANQGTPLDYPYLVLRIEGLDNLKFSNKNSNKGFAALYLKNTTGAHILPELGVLQRNILKFKTPLASLSNIEVSITKPDGTLFSFGETAGDTTSAYSNSFMLRVVTLEMSRKNLNIRAAF